MRGEIEMKCSAYFWIALASAVSGQAEAAEVWKCTFQERTLYVPGHEAVRPEKHEDFVQLDGSKIYVGRDLLTGFSVVRNNPTLLVGRRHDAAGAGTIILDKRNSRINLTAMSSSGALAYIQTGTCSRGAK